MTDAPKKTLLILGCGYLGSEVARQAVSGGIRVVALTHNRERAEQLRSIGVEQVVVAKLQSDSWHREIEFADWLLNCVGSSEPTLEGYRRSYVDGMRSVVGWISNLRKRVDSAVFTSSTSVYPQGDEQTIDESAPTTDALERAQLILEAEKLLLDISGDKVRRAFVLRLSGIYGPGRHHLLDQLREGADSMPLGEHRLNLIHRDDAASAIFACCRAGNEVTGGIFNVTDGSPARRSEVIAWLASRLGRPMPVRGESSSRRRPNPPDRKILAGKLTAATGWRPEFADFKAGYERLLGGAPGEI